MASIGLTLFVLVLSARRSGRRFNVGPRIFAANTMAFDLIYCVTNLLADVYVEFGSLSEERTTLVIVLESAAVEIQAWVLLVFNVTFIPMLVMSVLAVTTDKVITPKRSAKLFATLILTAGKKNLSER